MSGKEQSIDFGNGITIIVDVLNPIAGKLDVKKTHDSYDIINENMTFTLTVTAQNDAITDITITDTDSLSITNISKAIFKDMTVSVQGGSPFVPPEYATLDGELFDDGFTLAFPGVTLQPGEQIIVKFTLNFTDLITEVVNAKSLTTGRYEYTIYLNNGVFAEGVDSQSTPVKADIYMVKDITLIRDFFRKSGHTDFTNDYTAYWDNMRIGDGATLLNGATITDTFTGMVFAGMVPDPYHPEISIEHIKVSLYNKNNHLVANWYIPVALGVTGFTFTIPDSDEIVTSGTRPDGIIVFATTEGAEYGDIINAYPSKYFTTVADKSDFDDVYVKKYSNRLSAYINGDSPYIIVEVGIVKPGAYPTVNKTSEYVFENNVPAAINWTITAGIPVSCYGQDVHFFDDAWVSVWTPAGFRRFYLLDPQPYKDMVVTAIRCYTWHT